MREAKTPASPSSIRGCRSMVKEMQPPAEEASTDEKLPSGTSRAEFFTGRYGISAEVPTGDRRLLEVLRDNTRQ
jgi:hypothetical protein